MLDAKIFQSGNSQAIRLPKEYRFESDSVKINRIGNVLVIVPNDDPWRNFKEGIKEAIDFPIKDDKILKHKKVSI